MAQYDPGGAQELCDQASDSRSHVRRPAQGLDKTQSKHSGLPPFCVSCLDRSATLCDQLISAVRVV